MPRWKCVCCIKKGGCFHAVTRAQPQLSPAPLTLQPQAACAIPQVGNGEWGIGTGKLRFLFAAGACYFHGQISNRAPHSPLPIPHFLDRTLPRLLVLLPLFAFVLHAAGAQTGIERPLRERQTGLSSPASPETARLPDETPLPAINSLLSDTAAVEHALTQRYIRQYSAPGGIAWLNAALKRGEIYMPFIREEIAARDLPPELLYLPIIESGYHSGAKSRSGAVGLWQFMMNSIGPFDMQVNDMVDERRDFQKSTRGALRKLEENYRYLGSWPLALAAYNAGLGAVNRAIKKAGIQDYWRLCEQEELRAETVHYVPRLLAAAWILSQPRRFGIDSWPEKTEWETLPVGRLVSLELLAAETGIDGDILRRGNMELNYGITPPDASYRLKVPAQAAPLVAGILEKNDLTLLSHYRYVIKYGDTLSGLARHYGVPLKLIEEHNPGILGRYLKIGETVVIPALRETAPYPEDSGLSETQSDAPAFAGNHLVKKGETLWAIALAYSVDPRLLAQANGMEMNEILPEGKSLKVPIIE